MSITRRKFLKAGTLATLFIGLPAGAAINALGQGVKKDRDGNPFDPPVPEVRADALANYNKSAFASYLNSVFRLYTGYSTIDVALVEVKDLMPAAATAQNGAQCFSLLFRGGNVALPQNTYRIEHPSLGAFQLFLVPGSPDDNGAQSFVAIINRLPYSQALVPAPSRLSKPSDTVTPPPQTGAPPKATTPTPTNTTPPNKAKPSKKPIGDDELFEGILLN
jgi:hypothetical protein